jgi:hypothetical protein
VNATNIATATVDAVRARLSCAPQLNIKTDGPLDLKIDCSRAAVKGSRCAAAVVRLPRIRGQRVVGVVVTAGGRRLKSVRGRDVRQVVVPRASRKPFVVRIRLRMSGKGAKARRITLTRRVAGC